MLRFVTWKWDAPHWKKTGKYTAEHVNIMARMIGRFYHAPHEVVCITDDPEGIDLTIRVIPIWPDEYNLGRCWRRIKLFSPEMAEIIGPRFVSIDLDAVIVGEITGMFSDPADFRIWGEYWRKAPYCGGLMMMDAGARAVVCDKFDEWAGEYRAARGERHPYGSDQDHINRCLFPGESIWTMADGVFSFNHTVRRWNRFSWGIKTSSKYHSAEYARLYRERTGRNDWNKIIFTPVFDPSGEIPEGARIIFFNGKFDPADPVLQTEYPWIKEYWR